MCGICGVFGRDDGVEPVRGMINALAHRGPDDHGLFAGPRVALGMTRLAVIDTSTAGHQPMASADGAIRIVYNGETYNFREERARLEARGHRFVSDSDTEVVLRLYETDGDDFVQRLRGMFALAIFDARGGPGRERLILARDPLGVKPLLIARTPGALIFASELKALLASGLVPPEIDPQGLRLLLTFGSVTQPRTMLRGVEALPPAHRLVVDRHGERLECYWRLGTDRQAALKRAPYEEQVAAVEHALEESVRLQMVSDVPIGAFLSGGVDSSLLVALMSRVRGRGVKTFSVGFVAAEGGEIDETGEAERTARWLGTEHARVLVTGAQVRDCLADVARDLDQPSVDGVNAWFVSRAAREQVTVAISGTGGDELFAGYPWFQAMQQIEDARALHPAASALKEAIGRVASARVLDRLALTPCAPRLSELRGANGFVGAYAGLHVIFGEILTAQLMAAPLRATAGAGRALLHDARSADELAQAGTVERTTALVLRGYTANQLLRDIDAVSMAHSLEVRVPFLDTTMADVALSLASASKLGPVDPAADPTRVTYRHSGAKRVLIDIGRRHLPPDFDAQVKRGFSFPFDPWLRGPLREPLYDTLSERSVRARGLLDPQAVSALRKGFEAGISGWARPWLAMMLELWCREVLDQAPRR